MWEYRDNLGIVWRGHLLNVYEGQGTDVVYTMRSICGVTRVLSGSLLKSLKRIKENEESEI